MRLSSFVLVILIGLALQAPVSCQSVSTDQPAELKPAVAAPAQSGGQSPSGSSNPGAAEQPASDQGMHTPHHLPSEGGAPGAPTTDANPTKQASGTKVAMPTRIAGCIAGTFVGIPVCMVRRSKFENWYAVHSMVGNTGNKAARVTLRVLWAPFAVITGVCEAPADGTVNAIRYSSKPFSKDQFSLGELKQNQE